MKHIGRFQKVSAAAKRMYGPKVLLVCGYPEDEHEPFLSFVQKTKVADFPVVFAVQTDLERQVREIIDQDHKSGFMHSSPMPRAVIMSGVTGKEMNSQIRKIEAQDMDGWLLLPYLRWVGFAAALNSAIRQLNPGILG
ncbi:MAG: hypothetical protein ACQEUB_14885 [Thermodesulfobacteriota bacterium]